MRVFPISRHSAGAAVYYVYYVLLHAAALSFAYEMKKPLGYSAGDVIPVTCLNRTIDTGEHVQDETTGALQYVPFATCNETGEPLQLKYLDETDVNCTFPFLSDEMFHLLEFYVHHDSPLACRIPIGPLGGGRDLTKMGEEFVPLNIALAGKLEMSHLHIATHLNLILHLSSPDTAPAIDSAIAYSTSPLISPQRIKIGDSLPLQFKIRWYPSTNLPVSYDRASPHDHFTALTFAYCLLAALCGTIGTYAFLVGWEFPKRLRRFAMDRAGDAIIGGFGDGGGRNGGYGYGFGGGGEGKGGYGAKRKD